MATGGRVTGLHNVMTGRRLADRWSVLEAIGSGGQGVVYNGWDLKLRARVAIKILDPSLRSNPANVQRFVEEVDTLKRSAHTNIAMIHDFAVEDIVYLVMEFLDGPILKQISDESPGRRLPLQQIRRIFTQMLDALAVVHERGIIHRDLKPENVFVLRLGSGRRNTDVVKLIDFGIARFFGNAAAARPGLTQEGMVLGTPYYMAPEQCRGEEADNRTDLYAVGVMLYEAVTGRLPFNKPTNPEILVAHLNECPNAPRMINPTISPELEMVILKSLAKDPGKRFQDAVEFSEALEAAIPEDPTYYRDSQRVSPVNGKAVTAPPRVPTVAEEDRPTAERLDPTKTPTRLLSENRPPAGIALAKTITPADLKREAARAKMEVAIQFAKNFGVWIINPTRRTAVIAIGSVALVLVGLILLAALLSNGGKKTTASDAGVDVTTAMVTPKKETPPQTDQPDVIVLPVPIPVPILRDDAATDEPNNPPTATTVETDIPTVPADYAERLAESRRQESRGDNLVLRGKFGKALMAYQEALALLPDGAENEKIRLRSKIGELERRLR